MKDKVKQAANARAFYEKNKAAMKANARQHTRETGARLREFVNGLKAAPCRDCWHRFPPVCMDFDHVRGVKVADIAAMVTAACSLERLRIELAKCELVCANCHRLRTERRRDQGRSMQPAESETEEQQLRLLFGEGGLE